MILNSSGRDENRDSNSAGSLAISADQVYCIVWEMPFVPDQT